MYQVTVIVSRVNKADPTDNGQGFSESWSCGGDYLQAMNEATSFVEQKARDESSISVTISPING